MTNLDLDIALWAVLLKIFKRSTKVTRGFQFSVTEAKRTTFPFSSLSTIEDGH